MDLSQGSFQNKLCSFLREFALAPEGLGKVEEDLRALFSQVENFTCASARNTFSLSLFRREKFGTFFVPCYAPIQSLWRGGLNGIRNIGKLLKRKNLENKQMKLASSTL